MNTYTKTPEQKRLDDAIRNEVKNKSYKDAIVKIIAKDVLCFDTLETRYSDQLDFKECSVWDIKEALNRAYKYGMLSGMQEQNEKI